MNHIVNKYKLNLYAQRDILRVNNNGEDMDSNFYTRAQQPFFLERKADVAQLQFYTGTLKTYHHIHDIPLPSGKETSASVQNISLIPFCQAKERGFQVHDGGETIKTILVNHQQEIALDDFLQTIANALVQIDEPEYQTSRQTYQQLIDKIIKDEIGTGQGANFVIARQFTSKMHGDLLPNMLSLFRSLLINEIGAYSTFLFFDGVDYVIGASPERHISKVKNQVMMNPISGTFRKNETSAENFQQDFFAFLQDRKEIFELFMVMDEELKIMCELCDQGGTIIGPLIKEMSKLIHTEYLLIGASTKNIHELLINSMFAPTVTGSPVENAFRVKKKYETCSRGYYSSVIATIGTDADGEEMLDAPITIRTLEIKQDGTIYGRAGATLVRGSEAVSETKETEVKISGMLNSIKLAGSDSVTPTAMLGSINQEALTILLQERNLNLSRFWVEPQNKEFSILPELQGKKMLIIDAEDGFSNMLKRMINHLGVDIGWCSYKDDFEQDKAIDASNMDVMILGPGPGNPTDRNDGKMLRMQGLLRQYLQAKQKFFAECLSHQLLCDIFDLPIVQKTTPLQGTQEEILLFGRKEWVGFYNTFSAVIDERVTDISNSIGWLQTDYGSVQISFDVQTGEINALKGDFFFSCQFHPESILTPRGYGIISDNLKLLI